MGLREFVENILEVLLVYVVCSFIFWVVCLISSVLNFPVLPFIVSLIIIFLCFLSDLRDP